MTSNSKSLGEIFKHENNFNNWISENLDELSKIFTVDFDFQQKDSTKEGLRVNILAKFTSYNDDGNKKHTVIIESQLDTSDRKHLEQLITDGEQHDAKYCIWIAADFRPGHMRTLELLNELRMEGDRYFFAVAAEILSIKESPMVISFRIEVGDTEHVQYSIDRSSRSLIF